MININDYRFVRFMNVVYPDRMETVKKMVVRHKTTFKEEVWDIPDFWLEAMDKARHEGNDEGRESVRKAFGKVKSEIEEILGL